ncbi:MAG TPA: PaaI family thioesterase [Bradyrhizobium sp.]|nr:PaaI family thioesterase [Bradyrhizobium sp.]
MIEALQDYLSRSPLHRWLDCRITEVNQEGRLVVTLPFKRELRRDDGIENMAHGGVVAMLVDITAHAALHAQTGAGMPTIDLRIDYLRPAVMPLTAVGIVRRRGKTIGNADVEVHGSDGKLAATGRGVFLTLSSIGDGSDTKHDLPA